MRLKFPEPHFLPLKHGTVHKAAVSNDILHARVCLDHLMEHGSVTAVSLRFWSPTMFPIPQLSLTRVLISCTNCMGGIRGKRLFPLSLLQPGWKHLLWATEERAQCLLAER